jgi:hypothetical protein
MCSGNFPRVIKAGESSLGGTKGVYILIPGSGDEIREPVICRGQIFGSNDQQIGSEVDLPGLDQ